MNFAGYSCLRGDRIINKGYAAGGVMICIRKGIKYENINDLYFPVNVEGLGVKVSFHEKSINFIVIYRSLSRVNLIKVKEQKKMFKQFQGNSTIVIGDFNAHNIIWNYKNTDINGSNLYEITTNNDFYVVN